MPYVFFVLICLIWSSSFILMKKAAVAFTPQGIAAWRVIWGAAVLGWLCWRRGLLRLPAQTPWRLLLLVTVAGCVSPYILQPIVVNRQGSAFMAMCVSCLPVATILLSVPLLGVFPTRRQIVGVSVALACLMLLLADGLDRQIPWHDFALAVSVPSGYALTNTSIRRWLRDVPSLTLTFYTLAISSVVLFPFTGSIPGVPRDMWWQGFACLALLGVVGTGLATYWFNRLVQDHGPLFAGMVTNLVPIGAVLWGWMDKEQITSRQIVALAGILCAVTVVQYRAATSQTDLASESL